MVSAGDIRNGLTIEYDGNVYQVIEFQHVKPGKGAAFVRTKLKDIKNGGVIETSFRPTEKFPQARIDRVEMQYLYADGDLYNFMNMETYEQIEIPTERLAWEMKFMLEGANVQIVDELVGLIKAERAFESNSKLINSSSNILQLTNNMS